MISAPLCWQSRADTVIVERANTRERCCAEWGEICRDEYQVLWPDADRSVEYVE